MPPILALAVLLVSTPANAAPLVASEREPFLILVHTPRGVRANIRVSELLASAAKLLEPRTDFRVQSPEQAGCDVDRLLACEDKTRLSCWIGAVRRDAKSNARYFATFFVHPKSEMSDQITAMLFDTDRALEILRDSSGESAENQIFETAIESRTHSIGANDSARLDAVLEKILLEDFRSELERAGHWETFGQIELEAPRAGLIISVDGKAIGSTVLGVTLVGDASPGTHELAVSDVAGELEPWSDRVVVSSGSTSRAVATLREKPKAGGAAGTITMWSGVAVGASGLAIASWAALSSSSVSYQHVCASGACPGEATFFASFCEKTSGRCDGGVLAGPFGLALIAAGGAWSLGAGVIEDEAELPWMSIAAGVVLGVATYGVTALAGAP